MQSLRRRTVAAGAQQAHFTNLDGTVRVKKANSSTWSKADYSLPLEKGDIVQTASEGLAKIVFTDGTNYTVKQDSLIVIEENSANDRQQTNVAVNVNTGHRRSFDRHLYPGIQVAGYGGWRDRVSGPGKLRDGA